ncbi:MAG TPA: serine--tRNA ligase [Phycisphaerae bacterium]|nr:serine--tRNA ligase [Phycisphaerae bacterium]HPS52897.1 serine--tRNA ligase [Phycisphaerae bacterium]
MIDIKLLRENPDMFRQAAADKNMKVDIDALLNVDAEIRQYKTKLQDVKTAQNEAGKSIAKLPAEEKSAVIAEMARLKEQARQYEETLERLEPEFHELMLLMPQAPHPDAPRGKDDTQNVEVKRVGKVREFDFQPKDHVTLGEELDIIDIPRAVKLAGSRNFILKGAGCLLHQAVLRLALDMMVGRGYTPMTVPVLVNDSVMEGTGYFPLGREQAYLCERDGQALVGTAEVPVTAYHSDEILSEAELPKKYVAMSTCFRREAGAAGKDTRGLYRIHFFDKVEQVILCKADPQESARMHEEIIKNSEDLLQTLELPYRILEVCTGDMGQGKVRMYDIETWMPSRKSYGETHSASRFHDFQARRLNLRYKDENGKNQFVHTLNNTVVASPRILIPILELNQNADGSVTIPKALRPYMGGMEKIVKK